MSSNRLVICTAWVHGIYPEELSYADEELRKFIDDV